MGDNNNKHELWELKQKQSLPLSAKIRMTQKRIRQWVDEYGTDGVYISLSGGKDSTVLLDMVRKIYPDIKAVFVDTGLEYPEIREFVKQFDNVDWIKPKTTFVDVIKNYGYPLISKEVSECVYGARKYLTSILEENANLTDRPTVPLLLRSAFWNRSISEAYENRNTIYSITKQTGYLELADRISRNKFSRGGVR